MYEHVGMSNSHDYERNVQEKLTQVEAASDKADT